MGFIIAPERHFLIPIHIGIPDRSEQKLFQFAFLTDFLPDLFQPGQQFLVDIVPVPDVFFFPIENVLHR